MNLQTLSTAELYLETVKGTTPDVPLCCSSQKFGSSGHKGAASRTCTAAGEASRAGGRSPREALGNEPSKRVQACDLLGMNNSWGI